MPLYRCIAFNQAPVIDQPGHLSLVHLYVILQQPFLYTHKEALHPFLIISLGLIPAGEKPWDQRMHGFNPLDMCGQMDLKKSCTVSEFALMTPSVRPP